MATVTAFYPPPKSSVSGPQIAQHVATVKWTLDEEWFGGFSGIEVTPDGQHFFAVTDRGHVVRGSLKRDVGKLTGIEILDDHPLVDANGAALSYPFNDSEGLALDDLGRLHMTLERVHRINRYDDWSSPAITPPSPEAWTAFDYNGGMEMLAVDRVGTLVTIPETDAPVTTQAPVFRHKQGQKWDQPFTLPLTEGFLVVGGDFGPDGRLYILERGFTAYGFRSQVRRMELNETEIENIEIILQTPLQRHGNVEGLSVWADTAGNIRLTMISDNNFLPFIRTKIIEYQIND